MHVTIEYAAQVKRAAGVSADAFDVEPTSTVQDAVLQACKARDAAFRELVLIDGDRLHPSILLFADDRQIRWETPVPVREGMVISLLSPISGG